MSAIADFKKSLGPVAKAVEAETGFKAFMGLGQASHESGFGSSQLSSPNAKLNIVNNAGTVLRVGPANNYFGFTAGRGTYWRTRDYDHVLMPTTEYVPKSQLLADDKIISGPNKIGNGLYKITRRRAFRAYNSPEESYRDWARLMQITAYSNAGAPEALRSGNVTAFAAAMKKTGYATDPRYEELITNAITNLGSVV